MKKKPTRITADLTTTTFIDVIAADVGVTPREAREIVMAVFGAIARATASGHKVAITNFGTWLPQRVRPRSYGNPQTGGSVLVPAHRVVRFRVSPALADAVRRRDRHASIRKQPKGSKTPPAAPTAE